LSVPHLAFCHQEPKGFFIGNHDIIRAP
jgi:hypothetical protein